MTIQIDTEQLNCRMNRAMLDLRSMSLWTDMSSKEELLADESSILEFKNSEFEERLQEFVSINGYEKPAGNRWALNDDGGETVIVQIRRVFRAKLFWKSVKKENVASYEEAFKNSPLYIYLNIQVDMCDMSNFLGVCAKYCW